MNKTLAKIGDHGLIIGVVMAVATAESKAPSATIGIMGFTLALIGGVCLCLAFVFSNEAIGF